MRFKSLDDINNWRADQSKALVEFHKGIMKKPVEEREYLLKVFYGNVKLFNAWSKFYEEDYLEGKVAVGILQMRYEESKLLK